MSIYVFPFYLPSIEFLLLLIYFLCVSSSPVGYEAFLQKSTMWYLFCVFLWSYPARCLVVQHKLSVCQHGSLETFIIELVLDVQHDPEHSRPVTFATERPFWVEPCPGSGVERLLSCAVEHRCPVCIWNPPRVSELSSGCTQPPAEPSRSSGAESAGVSLQVPGSGWLKQSASVIAAPWESSPCHLPVRWPSFLLCSLGLC